MYQKPGNGGCVPCEALNWDELFVELDGNYVRKNTKVVVGLAHEMAHVWFGACYPFDAWLDTERFEEKAWEFHTGYEATAQALHVDY
jgi:hypothetical protein